VLLFMNLEIALEKGSRGGKQAPTGKEAQASSKAPDLEAPTWESRGCYCIARHQLGILGQEHPFRQTARPPPRQVPLSRVLEIRASYFALADMGAAYVKFITLAKYP
jgi:hypothetical protein